MTGSSVALDTNQAIRVLNDVAAVVAWLNSFSEVCLPVTVLGELRFGAMKPARPPANLSKIESLAARCRLRDIRGTTTERYARVRFDLLRKGRPIPENDVWIAATCLEHGVPLATDDGHFDAVEGLQLPPHP